MVMRKKIMAVIISAVLITQNLSVCAAYNAEDVTAYAAPYVVEGVNETISRGDCLASIMKLIGLRQETADRYFDVDFYKPVFADEYDDPNYLYNYGYLLYAQSYGVATGVYAEALHAYKFEPKRDVTIKECLTFMLRCLKDPKDVEWGNIMSDAEDMGLLTREEARKFTGDGSA